MADYYVNDYVQPNGDHEVHVRDCPRFPSNYSHLGDFPSCEPAVRAAKAKYPRANGCHQCCRACHSSSP